MLHDFLTSNRQELISRCRTKVAKRFGPTGTPAAIDHGVPLFLQQLVETLRVEETTSARGEAEPTATPAPTDIGRAAALHGAELLRLGYSVDQVVHDYGDLCQSVTALAVEQHIPISTDEFRTLNRCLDDAIADAVAAFGCARETSIVREAESLQHRLAIFVDEHRRLVDIVNQAFSAIKTGNIGVTGATGTLLIHALDELRTLVERTLPEIRPASPANAVVSQ
jgi:hypothetical protein